ncbi:MAG: HAD-IA family hydrolase [bacterium]|nr:HAD-IA family hydrolase [bacterium]
MYKALLLDFGGVVFKNKARYEGPQGLLDIDKDLWDQGLVGKISDDTLFSVTGEKYNVDAETIKSWLLSRREINEELISLLSRLKPGIKTAVVNNGIKTLFHMLLDKYDVTSKFNLVINSAEEGVKKPDPNLYLITCDRLEVTPKECVFVDDNESFINGAEQVGMHGCYFSTVDNLAAELSKLDLLVI